MPDLFIIAGPNGAGKSTYVRDFLPQEMRCREFVNADLIAAGLSPFAPDTVAFEAGRIMLKRLRDLFERRADFSFETTLTGFGYTHLLREMKEAGYRIRLDYLWISNLDITRQRVKQRVKKGGRDIPDDVQQRRFGKGLRLLLEHYRPLVHDCASTTTPARPPTWSSLNEMACSRSQTFRDLCGLRPQLA